MVTATKLPFSKLKPGMCVRVTYDDGSATGRLLGKHNGTKTVTVLLDHASEPVAGIPAEAVEVLPVDPFDQIHPMLAKSLDSYKNLDKDELLADPDWGLEEKYDGERQILAFFPRCTGPNRCGFCDDEKNFLTDRGDCRADQPMFRATTRVVGKNTGVLGENSAKLPHLSHLPVPLEGTTVFDCELMHPEGFRVLRSIMGSDTERALALQDEHGPVYAVVFDVLWFGGRDLRSDPFENRRTVLEHWYDLYARDWAEAHVASDRLPLVRLSPITWDEAEKRAMLDDILRRGGEGAMLKYRGGVYTDTTLPGQRSPHLLKVKSFQEDDVIIYGFERGKGEYNQHKFGAIKFAQWVHEDDISDEMVKNILTYIPTRAFDPSGSWGYYFVHMGTCSGITDEQEAMFRADPEKYIGMPMKVKFQSRWPDTGLMRHPNFVRLRDDKSPSECIYVPVR